MPTQITLDGRTISYEVWGAGPPTIVLLHEGLGSIRLWKSVPEAVAERTGETVMAYERPGHGSSLPVPTGPWPADWLHIEAAFLARLLGHLGVERPLLVGHSDGGSIALLAAAEGHLTPRGILTLAAHSWVEQLCYDSIVEMRADAAGISARLARSHDAPAALFEAWSGVWVSAQFRDWDMRPALHTIDVPTLVAQGSADEYACQEHPMVTAESIGANATSELLPGLGHLLHHEDPAMIIDLIVRAATEFQ